MTDNKALLELCNEALSIDHFLVVKVTPAKSLALLHKLARALRDKIAAEAGVRDRVLEEVATYCDRRARANNEYAITHADDQITEEFVKYTGMQTAYECVALHARSLKTAKEPG